MTRNQYVFTGKNRKLIKKNPAFQTEQALAVNITVGFGLQRSVVFRNMILWINIVDDYDESSDTRS